jgi:hypothetical protein
MILAPRGASRPLAAHGKMWRRALRGVASRGLDPAASGCGMEERQFHEWPPTDFELQMMLSAGEPVNLTGADLRQFDSSPARPA